MKKAIKQKPRNQHKRKKKSSFQGGWTIELDTLCKNLVNYKYAM